MENILPKWLVAGLGILLIVFVALLIVQKGHDLQTTFKNAKPANTISVSGVGKVTATPDLASISAGVFTQGPSATDIKNQNNDKVNKIIAFAKSLNIDQKDIQTSQYSLQPQYDYSKGTPVVNGYQVTQTVTIKVHGVDKDTSIIDKLVEGVVNNGANQVYGVNLSVEKPDDLQQSARKLAIDDAKKKAQELAAQAGLTLGKVVSISESTGGYPGPIPYATNQAMGMGGGGDVKTIAPDIQTGSQEITETMTVTYEVK